MTIGGTTTAPTKGTITLDEARWRRVGDSMEIIYNYRQSSTGSAGSGVYLFPIPDGKTIDTAKMTTNGGSTTNSYRNVGTGFTWNSTTGLTATGGPLVVQPYNTTNLALIRTIVSGGTLQGSRAYIGSGEFALSGTTMGYSFRVTVPIAEWANSNDQFLFANPLENVCTLSNEQTGDTASSATTDNVLVFNTQKGDCSFVSLSANQIDLGNGKYRLKGWGKCLKTGDCQLHLFDVDAAGVKTSGAFGKSASADTVSDTVLVSEDGLLITTPTTFELRLWTELAATNGLCDAVQAGTNNPNTVTICNELTIERVK